VGKEGIKMSRETVDSLLEDWGMGGETYRAPIVNMPKIVRKREREKIGRIGRTLVDYKPAPTSITEIWVQNRKAK